MSRPDQGEAAALRSFLERILDPLLDPGIHDADRATLLVDVFRSVLAARVLPLLGEAQREVDST